MAKCNALHTIINSNHLLSILKAPLNIECHFLSILIHIYIHTHTQYILLLNQDNHWATSSTYFLSLLFFFKLFFSLLSTTKQKQKQKPLLLPISPYLQLHFLQPFPSLFTFLLPPLLSNSPLHFLHHFS